MSKSAGIKVARGILFVIVSIVAVVVVIVLIATAFITAMNTTNVNMLVKDAFAKRAEAVLNPVTDGSDRITLEKLFAPRVIAMDEMLNSTYYDLYEIDDYYEHLEVEFHVVWPWNDETTVEVTEIVRDITGQSILEQDTDAEFEASETEIDLPKEKPLPWKNGIYEVTLRKDRVTDSWKIYGLELIEPIMLEDEEEIDSNLQQDDEQHAPQEVEDLY